MLLIAPVLDKHRVPLSPEDEAALESNPDLVSRVNVVRSTVPAITHVDYSARVQTVDERHGRLPTADPEVLRQDRLPNRRQHQFQPVVGADRPDATGGVRHLHAVGDGSSSYLEDFVLHKNDQPLGMKVWAQSVSTAAPDPDSPWADPITGDPLVVTDTGARNTVTGATYPVEGGIPRLFVLGHDAPTDHDVTEMVKQFYEATPFPNYDELDNRRALLEKAREGLFARLLNEQIPYTARVLEIGCGTGQLTNFLAIAHRACWGLDVCLNSLRLAQEFKVKHGVDRAAFAQMNLFHPALKEGFFDVVISNGVLHHTGDCRGAFRRISQLVKPGGS